MPSLPTPMYRSLRKAWFFLIFALGAFQAGTVAAAALNVTRLLPDPGRSRIYAITGNGQEQGSLLVIDSQTRNVVRTIALGKKPTDCDIGDGGKTLFTINSVDQTINEIDLETLLVTKTHTLPAYTNWGAAETHAHVRAGKGNILYYVDGQWGPRLRVFNRVTGQVLQTFGAQTTGTSNDDGIGGLVLAPNGSAIYTWKQYGWSAGVLGTYISKFNVLADGTLAFQSQTGSARTTNFDRDPLDTPAMITADGSRLIVKDRAFLTADLGNVPVVYPDEIYSITRGGEIAASAGAIYSGQSGEILHTLPVAAPVQAITPDYSSMVYFNPTTQALVWLDLVTTLGTTALGLNIAPADGATVVQPTELRWIPATGIPSYQVYLGTNRSEVEAATTASTSYLGETGGTSINLTKPLVTGQMYFWRVVPVGADGLPAGAGVTRSFRVSNLSLSRSSITAETVEGVSRHLETISLQAAGAQSWSATADVPWITFENNTGSTPGNLVAIFNPSTFKAGSHFGNIILESGGVSFAIPVSMKLYPANYMISEADRELPWVYVISQESNTSVLPSFLLRINTATNQVESAVACGRSVTDVAIHYQENRIYLTNWQTGVLRAFDRGTFAQVQTYQFTPVGPIGYGEGGLWRVSAGKKGRLILEESDQWIDIRLIDTAKGTVLAANSSSEYAGNGEADPTGRYYYHSGLGTVSRYDLIADGFSKLSPSPTAQGSSVVMIGDGSRVTGGAAVFNAQLGLELTLPAEVRAGTLHGELLFTSAKAYNGKNGLEMATLPVTTTVMSVTGDQKKLYLFSAKSKAFQTVDLSTIAKVSPLGLIPGIADGTAAIGTAQELAWSIEAAALSYNVYFGSSATAVGTANTTSPEFLGNTSGTRWTGAMPALEFGKTYWWRVDIVKFDSTVVGATWSFRIPVMDVVPRVVDLAYPASSPVPMQRLSLTAHADGGSPVAWTASTTTPWITLKNLAGSAPGNFDFEVNTVGQTAGMKQGAITFTAAGESFTVPVNLTVIALNVTKLVGHPTRPVVYGINTAGAGQGFSHLLEIDAATATILRSMPIGFSPTDADLDAASERLYISNWGYSATRVIDVAAWSELPSLSLGSDVYRLEITSQGRVVTEEQDQWIDLGLWNAATGLKLNGATSVREGDGETDPSGKFYYHSDNNSSGAIVTKYDISGDSFVEVASGPQISYGSRNLILSGDGSKLFWLGRVLDADLRSLGQLPAEVHATTRAGDLAIGASLIWWSDSGTQLSTLPFASTVAAVSANDSNLVRFNATTKMLHSISLATITDLPGPFPRPGQVVNESPARLSWSPVPGATAYQVFIAPDAIALSAMTIPLATVATTYYDLPAPLAFGKFYSWRVDAVTAGGVVAGKVQSFGIRFPAGPVLPPLAGNTQGVAASMSDRHLLVGGNGTARLYAFDPAMGVATAIQNFTRSGFYADHYFGASVAVDAGKAAIGAYADSTPASDGGTISVYRPNLSGAWESSGLLSLPTPLPNELFGSGLAASGNQILAGTGFQVSRIGRVAAYVTEPSTLRMQTFTANDGVAGDGFGQVIAMEGNQAIISAPGRGASYNRVPALYAFSRSTKTGLWTQTQKFAIPGATSFSASGTVLALSGNWLATNNGTAVEIYVRNEAGQWTPSASIKRTAVTGSSSGGFGRGLALSGDLLFIGDAGATNLGTTGGAVFSFRRSGSAWIAGPVIAPTSGSYYNFGAALAVRDGWLLATGDSAQAAHLFRVDAAANQTPRFIGNIPSQVVADRPFSIEIRAEDGDGNKGLVFDILQGPAWLQLINDSDGKAILSGVPVGNADSAQTVQIRVRDSAGAQALHTYQLTLLAATSLPSLTLEPVGGDVGEGQEVALRAAVTGIGPFAWQWYLNGKPISGANSATLFFGEISLADEGEYTVSVSNVVGQDESSGVFLHVHAANRFAGDWPTFGGGRRHTGYHPARLGKHDFVPAWSSNITPNGALNRAATGDGKVFVTPQLYFSGSYNATALDLESGKSVWKHAFIQASSLNPPTYHHGRVYIQRGNHGSDTQLWALDSGTGATAWSSPHGAQWEDYESPTVTDAGIWVNGGSYGGMYGFSPTGTQTFFRELAQYDEWTPTVSNGQLYSWVAGLFQEHNPADGSTLWSVDTGWDWRGWSMNTVSAVSGDSAVVISTTEIVCIDLPSRSIRWRKTGSFQGSPAIAGGRVFGIQDKSVASFSLADGVAGPVITVPEPISSGQPLLVMDYLFVASAANTYVVDRATSAIVRTLPGGGLLSFGHGHLFAAGTDGTLRAWFANQSLEFISTPAPIVANDRGDASQLNLAEILQNPDGDGGLQWEIIANTNPSIFSSIQVAQDGLLQVAYAPYLSGSSTVAVQVRNSAGASATTSVQITLPPLPAPSVKINPSIVLNRATGLYQQKVRVKNVAGRAIAGFELEVSGLPNGVSLHNATWPKKGGGTFVWNQPLAAGQSVTVTLKYYNKLRGAIRAPTIGVKIMVPAVAAKKPVKSPKPTIAAVPPVLPAAAIAPPAIPFAISRCERFPDGTVVIEFPAEPGHSYHMEYSEDAIHWKQCPDALTTNGTHVQWLDRGPPSTESTPASESRRFYRVGRTAP